MIDTASPDEVRKYLHAGTSKATRAPTPRSDSLVVEILNGLLKQGEAFDTFEPGETWNGDYGVYCRSVAGFRQHFGLDEFSIRDIDNYLWMVAKERAAST